MNEDKLSQFEAVMEMPPFEDHVDKGGELWQTAFKNGKTYSSCFSGDDKTIRTQYPLWNAAKGKVIGLEQALLDCLYLHDPQMEASPSLLQTVTVCLHSSHKDLWKSHLTITQETFF
jgi:hypothetical protein